MKVLFGKHSVVSICIVLSAFLSVAWCGEKVDSAAPKIYYHFKVEGELSGGEEMWVNKVYLGKLPLTITRQEFMEKVPYMAQPPEGYADEEKRKMNGHWFRIRVVDLGKEVRRSRIRYSTLDKVYCARVKLDGEWGKEGLSTGPGGGGGNIRQDYDIPIRAKFSSREKLIAEKDERLKTLLRIARINDYTLSGDWYRALDTYGEKTWRDFTYRKEPGIKKLMAGWACWKFKIDNPDDIKSARKGFEQVCKCVNERKEYCYQAIEGKAVELIYDKLDLDNLIRQFNRDMSGGKDFSNGYTSGREFGGMDVTVKTNHDNKDHVEASTAAILHALKFWDKKFDTEKPETPNRIELEVVPLLIQRTKGQAFLEFEEAVKIGGPVMFKYLTRKNWRTRDSSDSENVSIMIMHGCDTNRWFYYLVNMDDPQARKFRQQHSDLVIELTDNCISKSSMMHSSNGEPPHFLVLDAELGKNSIGWRYRNRYAAKMKTHPWTNKIINYRFRYLAEFEGTAVLDDFLEAWHDTHKTKSRMPLYTSVGAALQTIPKSMRKEFGERLLDYYEKKLEALGKWSNENRDEYHEYDSAISRTKRNMVRYAGGDYIEYRIKTKRLTEKGDGYNDEIDTMKNWNGGSDPAYVDYFSRHKSKNVRLLALIGIEYFPSAENRKTLKRLLNDPDEEVKSAAIKTVAEIERIRNLPLESLVAYPPKGKEQG